MLHYVSTHRFLVAHNVRRTLSQDGYGGARYNDYKCVVNVGRVANGEWLTVELTPDLETNWPVVFQLQV